MSLLCHPWFTTTNFSYRFPILETSATALRYYWYVYNSLHFHIYWRCSTSNIASQPSKPFSSKRHRVHGERILAQLVASHVVAVGWIFETQWQLCLELVYNWGGGCMKVGSLPKSKPQLKHVPRGDPVKSCTAIVGLHWWQGCNQLNAQHGEPFPKSTASLVHSTPLVICSNVQMHSKLPLIGHSNLNIIKNIPEHI